MTINRGRKISSLLNKKHPFSGFKLWYFIPLKKIKVKKKIQDIEDFRKRGQATFSVWTGNKKGDRLLFLYGLSSRKDSPSHSRKSSLSPFLLFLSPCDHFN
jgi:hypothetical protein